MWDSTPMIEQIYSELWGATLWSDYKIGKWYLQWGLPRTVLQIVLCRRVPAWGVTCGGTGSARSCALSGGFILFTLFYLKLKYDYYFYILIYFLTNILGWQWLIKLHRIQVYNSIIHYLYIVLCVYHPSQGHFCHHLSSLYLLPSLPPVHPSLWQSPYCCLCPWVFLYFAISSPFSPVPNLLSSDSRQSVLCMHEPVSTLLVYFVH